MGPFFLFALAVVSAAGLILNWQVEALLHDRRLKSKKLRIHVNGIRGKSTVTRILAGMLREANFRTVAKTTGSAACVIDLTGEDRPIRRRGAPTILEQIKIVRDLDDHVEALVIECMAIKPEYQRICEKKIIQSNIGVITNVREDHQDVLGDSLEEIARNLLSTCPQNGVLITAEQAPRLLTIFRKVAKQKHTRLIVANPDEVSDDQLKTFPYVAFKENVAIGFALADLLNIDQKTAMEGMVQAAPDPGVLKIVRRQHLKRNIMWADLFAVNDRESVISCVEKVGKLAEADSIKIGLLNNRSDREHRAIQFANIAARDIALDYVALLGAYEQRVEVELVNYGFAANRIIRLGAPRGASGAQMIEALLARARGKNLLIFGLVNIHTPQAESLREWFHENDLGGSHGA